MNYKGVLKLIATVMLGLAAIWFIGKGISAFMALPYQRIINNHQRLTFYESKITSQMCQEFLNKKLLEEKSFKENFISKLDSISNDEQVLMLQIENFPDIHAEMTQNAQQLHELMKVFREYRINEFRGLGQEYDIMRTYYDTLKPIITKHYQYSIFPTEEQSKLNKESLLVHILTN